MPHIDTSPETDDDLVVFRDDDGWQMTTRTLMALHSACCRKGAASPRD